jgi:hypothetical protein
VDAFSKSTETQDCENHKMAKVDRNTIQNALDEFNTLEYELSFDEQCRELDEFEKDDWQSELELPEYHDARDDWYDEGDYPYDNYPYDDPYYDYDCGDF